MLYDIPGTGKSSDLQDHLYYVRIVSKDGAISPDVPYEGEFDVRDYYLANRIGVFLSLALFYFAAWIADLVIAGFHRLEVEFMIMSVLIAIAMVALAFTKRVWVHVVILGLSFLTVLGDLFTEMSYHDSRWLTP